MRKFLVLVVVIFAGMVVVGCSNPDDQAYTGETKTAPGAKPVDPNDAKPKGNAIDINQ